VRRTNSQVLGPFVPTEWKQSALPPISTVDWIAPKNPNFWLPLMGDLMFLAFVLVYQGWPILLVLVLVISLLWFYRRRAKGNENAA